MERSTEFALDLVVEWGNANGVSVSWKKTCMMLMRGRLSDRREPSVRVRGERVRYEKSVRYLGVTIGERMNFGPHLRELRTKVMNVIGCLRRVLRAEWGLGKRAVRMIYRGVFVACVTYAAGVWYDMFRHKNARDAISVSQRMVLYACVRACRTVSTEAMRVLMGVLPWDMEIVMSGARMCAKRQIPPWTRMDVLEGMDWEGVDDRARKDWLKDRMIARHQDEWNTSSRGRVTYEWIRSVTFASENEWFDPCWGLSFLLTGHGSMNEYLERMGLAISAECPCGESPETWRHLLWDCRLYDAERAELIRRYGRVDDVSELTTRQSSYECVSEFATKMFETRRGLLQE